MLFVSGIRWVLKVQIIYDLVRNSQRMSFLLQGSPSISNRLIYVLCHNFWTNYDLDLLSTSKRQSESQFCKRYLENGKKLARNGKKGFLLFRIFSTSFAFCHFSTISSQFFAIFISIFHKTEIQTVILRCWTGLNHNWFKSYEATIIIPQLFRFITLLKIIGIV